MEAGGFFEWPLPTLYNPVMAYPAGCTPTLAAAFPVVLDGSPLATPDAFALRALPGALFLLAWFAVELRPRRLPAAARRQGVALALLAPPALGVLAWHAFDLFACYPALAPLAAWRYVAVLGAPLLALGLLLLAGRAPRPGILLATAAAGGTVVADWAVRSAAPVGAPFAAAGHLFLLVAAALLAYAPGAAAAPPRPCRCPRLLRWLGQRQDARQPAVLDPTAGATAVACEAPGKHTWFV